MQGELTLRLSSSWMYIAYTSLLFDYPYPFVDELTKRGRWILRVYICMFISLFMYIYLFSLCILLNIFIVYCYAWVNGELLLSLSLIHAYITPWVLSSSKRERLLSQRPITLVLMMIKSSSYSTNDLVFI